jgi:predicted TIM-barrel fold metal-dependent hydrolase
MNDSATNSLDYRLSRREWTTSAVGAASLAMLPSSLWAKVDAEKHPWVDAHSHIWTRDVEKFPLANGSTVDDLAPPSFTAEELLDVAHKNGVGRVVLIQHHRYHGWDNSYLIDAALRYPDAFRVVGMVDNLAPDAAKTMEKLLPQRVTGFRITPWVHKEKWLDGEMDAMWRTAAKTGQNMCCLIDAKDLAAVDAMCKRFPDTPVVIDHFARIGVDGEIRDADVDALCALAKHKHTTVKISAYYALGKKQPPYLDLVPMIGRMLDAFGVERCMWASDSPYQIDGEHTYAASIELVRDRLDGLSDGDREWLLRKTAEKVFYA